MTKLQKILIYILLTLLVLLFTITIIRFIFFSDTIGSSFRKKEATIEQAIAKYENNDLSVFSSIGRLRLNTGDEESTIIILTPYFSYPKSDADFYAELATKNQKMRFLISEYFANKSFADIQEKKEIQIKQELLDILNAELVMGTIKELYFDEYIFLD